MNGIIKICLGTFILLLFVYKWTTIKHKYLEIKIKGSVQLTPFWYALFAFYDHHRLFDLFLLIPQCHCPL